VPVQAPVQFALDASPGGAAGGLRVRARNKNAFASTAGLLLSWRVLLDGAPLVLGDPAQRDAAGWYPGGSVAIAPQARVLAPFAPCRSSCGRPAKPSSCCCCCCCWVFFA
jgi:hypothetical protein